MSHSESSVLSSIQDLMFISAERVIEEKQRTLAAAARARHVRRQTFAVARRTRRLRKAAAQRRVEAGRQRFGEEQARLSAMHARTVEAARAEAEQRGRLQLTQLELEHKQKLATMERSSGRWQLYTALLVFVSLLLALGGGAGLAVRDMTQNHTREVAALTAELARSQQQSDNQAGRLQSQEEQLRSLQDDLAAARAEARQARAAADKAAADADKAAASAVAKATARRIVGAPRRQPPAPDQTPSPAADCDPLDPLCASLPL